MTRSEAGSGEVRFAGANHRAWRNCKHRGGARERGTGGGLVRGGGGGVGVPCRAEKAAWVGPGGELIRGQALEGAGDFVDVFGLEAGGAAQIFCEDPVNDGDGLAAGEGGEAGPLAGDGLALLVVGVFAELAHGFIESAVLVGHVLVKIAAQETAEGGEGGGRDVSGCFARSAGGHERHSG